MAAVESGTRNDIEAATMPSPETMNACFNSKPERSIPLRAGNRDNSK
jgi:hypothetical protein